MDTSAAKPPFLCTNPLALGVSLLFSLFCCLYKLTREFNDKLFKTRLFAQTPHFPLLWDFVLRPQRGRFLCGSTLL